MNNAGVPVELKRGRDLARNDAALAHARDHHPAAAAVDQLDRIVESRSHRPRNAVGQRAQRLSLDPDYVFANVFHGSKRC